MRYIEINKEIIPYQFQLSLGQKTYDIEVNYNEEFCFFTLDLSIDGEVIVLGEKVTYGRPLFPILSTYIDPAPVIIPFDVAQELEAVTFENLGEQVFLFITEEV